MGTEHLGNDDCKETSSNIKSFCFGRKEILYIINNLKDQDPHIDNISEVMTDELLSELVDLWCLHKRCMSKSNIELQDNNSNGQTPINTRGYRKYCMVKTLDVVTFDCIIPIYHEIYIQVCCRHIILLPLLRAILVTFVLLKIQNQRKFKWMNLI